MHSAGRRITCCIHLCPLMNGLHTSESVIGSAAGEGLPKVAASCWRSHAFVRPSLVRHLNKCHGQVPCAG